MKKQKINLPIDGKPYPVEIKIVQHKDGTESVFCWATLDNGKKFKMEAELTPLNPPDENGHKWHIRCNACSTHAHDSKRLADAFNMFMWDIEVFNSVIEADKYVEVEVKIPKGEYCNPPQPLQQCPLLDDGCGGEYDCQCHYLKNTGLYIGLDDSNGMVKKDKCCPARQKNSR